MQDREDGREICFEISRRLSKAFSAKSVDGIVALYNEAVTIWHNHTNSVESKDENAVALGEFFGLFSEVSYRDVQFTWTEEGFVQRHVIAGALVSNGAMVEIPACLVVVVRNGSIVRLDEYGDPAPLLAALGAGLT